PRPPDSAATWCLIVEEAIQSRINLNPALWKLYLTDGSLSQLEVPTASTPHSLQVASDGQTVVFFDDGFVYQYDEREGTSDRVSQVNDLVAWHPDGGMRKLFQYPAKFSVNEYHEVLPGRRVLLVDTEPGLEELNIRIISLDDAPPHQIFP